MSLCPVATVGSIVLLCVTYFFAFSFTWGLGHRSSSFFSPLKTASKSSSLRLLYLLQKSENRHMGLMVPCFYESLFHISKDIVEFH